jgi:hypothetical protein
MSDILTFVYTDCDAGISDRSDGTALLWIISGCFGGIRIKKITFLEKSKVFF